MDVSDDTVERFVEVYKRNVELLNEIGDDPAGNHIRLWLQHIANPLIEELREAGIDVDS